MYEYLQTLVDHIQYTFYLAGFIAIACILIVGLLISILVMVCIKD